MFINQLQHLISAYLTADSDGIHPGLKPDILTNYVPSIRSIPCQPLIHHASFNVYACAT